MKTCKKSVSWMSLYITLITITFIACDTKEEMLGDRIGDPMADSVELADFYVGADLSYTSELEKIGVKYTLGGEEMDVVFNIQDIRCQYGQAEALEQSDK